MINFMNCILNDVHFMKTKPQRYFHSAEMLIIVCKTNISTNSFRFASFSFKFLHISYLILFYIYHSSIIFLCIVYNTATLEFWIIRKRFCALQLNWIKLVFCLLFIFLKYKRFENYKQSLKRSLSALLFFFFSFRFKCLLI